MTVPDLLGHALLAYTVARLLSLRSQWLDGQYVTVVMAGAFVPDLTKVALLVPSEVVASALGVPFSWYALHTLGGATVSIAIGCLLVGPGHRRRVGALLSLGAASHLVADALLRTPTGRAGPLLWPVTRWHPPSPGLYLSTEPWPTLVFALTAVLTWVAVRRTGHSRSLRR